MSSGLKADEQRNKDLARAVKRYNDKIRRELKKNPSMKVFLPPKTSVKQEKATYTSPKEIRRRINALNRIYNEKALTPILTNGGVTTTKYELDEMKRTNDFINKRRKEELKKLPKNPEKYGTAGSIEQNTLKPRKFNARNVNKKEFEKFKEALLKQSKDDYFEKRYELYKENYLKAIRQNMDFEGEKIEELLKFLTNEEINKAYYTNPFLTIKSIYKKPGESEEDNYENEILILEEWINTIKTSYNTWNSERKNNFKNQFSNEFDFSEWDNNKRRKRK